jgi:hypothetical protein
MRNYLPSKERVGSGNELIDRCGGSSLDTRIAGGQ